MIKHDCIKFIVLEDMNRYIDNRSKNGIFYCFLCGEHEKLGPVDIERQQKHKIWIQTHKIKPYSMYTGMNFNYKEW